MKRKWQAIEKKITRVALNRQTVSQMENDMERWLKVIKKTSIYVLTLPLLQDCLATFYGSDNPSPELMHGNKCNGCI